MITLMMHKEVVDGHFVDAGFTHKAFDILYGLHDDLCVLKAPSLTYKMIIPNMEQVKRDLELTEDILEEIFDELDEKDVPAKPYFYVDAGETEPSTEAQEETPEPECSDTDRELGSEAEPVQEPTPSEYECILVNGTDFKGWVSSLHGQDTASDREA